MLCVTLYLAKESSGLLIFHIHNIHYGAYLNALGTNDFHILILYIEITAAVEKNVSSTIKKFSWHI